MKGSDGVLFHDGLEAIAGVVYEGYHYIDGGHGVLLYDGSDRLFSVK